MPCRRGRCPYHPRRAGRSPADHPSPALPAGSQRRRVGDPRATRARRRPSHRHPVLAEPGVNTTTVLDLIAAPEAAASAALDELREQQARLAAEVAAIECELAALATTRQTLNKMLEDELTASEPALISEPYQQILTETQPGLFTLNPNRT
jgi:hypothetical protein